VTKIEVIFFIVVTHFRSMFVKQNYYNLQN